MKPKSRLHRGSDYYGRGNYSIPATALVGASDCGTWPDSPAPSHEVSKELRRFAKEVLRPAKCPYRTRYTRSGNVFMVKRWITVPANRWPELIPAALKWVADNQSTTRYAHDADLNEIPVCAV